MWYLKTSLRTLGVFGTFMNLYPIFESLKYHLFILEINIVLTYIINSFLGRIILDKN